MTYKERRAWSEKFTHDVLLPFINAQPGLPFENLRTTQEGQDWLARGIDMITKADAVASRGGGWTFVAIRCQRVGRDMATITIRWPSEYEAHAAAHDDPTIMGVGYIIHAYAASADGPLICAYVAETSRVIESIDNSWDRDNPAPFTLRASEDGQEFVPVRARRIGALRLAPDVQPTLLKSRAQEAIETSRRWQATPEGQEWLRWIKEFKAERNLA